MDISTEATPARATAGGVPGDRLSGPLAAVLAAARRRAARCGDRVTDTAHLLHALLESDAAVRAAIGGGWTRTAKLLGYLAQRSIGYGQNWRHTVEEAHGPYAAAAAPDSRGASDASGVPGTLNSPGTSGRWSPAAVAALAEAADRAAARGAAGAEGVDLFAALAADPECRAAEVLRNAGVEQRALAAALAGLPPADAPSAGLPPAGALPGGPPPAGPATAAASAAR